MPDMKHFLERNSTFGKTILVMGMVLPVAGVVLMGWTLVGNGAPLAMVLFPGFPFLLMSAFCAWVFRKSSRDIPMWWESLTDSQRADYEQDFANAQPMDDFLLLGQRYAYFRNIGRPVAYGDIADIYFHRSRSGNGMHVILLNGTHLATIAPTFTNRPAIINALMQRCGNM